MQSILNAALYYENSDAFMIDRNLPGHVYALQPYYSFLARRTAKWTDIVTINHVYDGRQLQSILSLVEYEHDSSSISHYVIRPASDRNLIELFDVESISVDDSHHRERTAYFCSAVIAILQNNNLPRFDILNLHSKSLGAIGKRLNELAVAKTPLDTQPFIISTIPAPQSPTTVLSKAEIQDLTECLIYSNAVIVESDISARIAIKAFGEDLCKLLFKIYDEGRLYTSQSKHTILEMHRKHLLQRHATTIIKKSTTIPISEKGTTIRTMHVALEYGAALLGGLGSVTTQMIEAQNIFQISDVHGFTADIITPYYAKMYNYTSVTTVAEVMHTYNNTATISKVLLHKRGRIRHYMIMPSKDYAEYYSINRPNEIYIDTEAATFIERLKYFNSAVAAYLHNRNLGVEHPNARVLLLHDWQAALVPRILREVHNSNAIKSIFIVHVANVDFGGYPAEMLQGIGLKFSNRIELLKGIGLKESHKIVAVSKSFLQECMKKYPEPQLEYLRKLFVMKSLGNNVHGILNGFAYSKFTIAPMLTDPYNIIEAKLRIKQRLAEQLQADAPGWSINFRLPVIFFIGRFSPEKGVDTFAQVIKVVNNKAIFFALGRGLTASVERVIMKHSNKTANIYISNDESKQLKYGSLMRACADWTFIPSHREACGLVSMEGFANGSLCITSGVGGLRDSVSPITIHPDKSITGNAFLYEDSRRLEDNPALTDAVNSALLFWSQTDLATRNQIHLRLIEEAKGYDWQAPNGSLSKYYTICKDLYDESTSESTSKARPTA